MRLKLASVASDPLGASGRAMLKAILAGEQDPARLAEMARGCFVGNSSCRWRSTAASVPSSLPAAGILRSPGVCGRQDRTTGKEIAARLRPFEDDVRRLCTIPGWIA